MVCTRSHTRSWPFSPSPVRRSSPRSCTCTAASAWSGSGTSGVTIRGTSYGTGPRGALVKRMGRTGKLPSPRRFLPACATPPGVPPAPPAVPAVVAVLEAAPVETARALSAVGVDVVLMGVVG
jgi:hypothetical protein